MKDKKTGISRSTLSLYPKNIRYTDRLVQTMIEFKITDEYIELIKLLKATQVAESGAMAKTLVENGEVLRNGEVETRKRAKILPGETIETLGETIKVI